MSGLVKTAMPTSKEKDEYMNPKYGGLFNPVHLGVAYHKMVDRNLKYVWYGDKEEEAAAEPDVPATKYTDTKPISRSLDPAIDINKRKRAKLANTSNDNVRRRTLMGD